MQLLRDAVCLPVKELSRKGKTKEAKSVPEGLGSGTQSCWFPVSPPPSRISTTLVGANCQGKHRLSPESRAANTPELEGPQIPSPSSSSIKQVHYTDSSRSCAQRWKSCWEGEQRPCSLPPAPLLGQVSTSSHWAPVQLEETNPLSSGPGEGLKPDFHTLSSPQPGTLVQRTTGATV